MRRLKLIDEDGRVSLTNLAFYLSLGLVTYVVLRKGDIDPTALGALLTALGAYRGKMWQVDKRESAKLKAELAEARALAGRSTRSATPSPLPSGLR
jgi:hypothetical protein